MDSVTQYFNKEKKESVYFISLGFLACLISVFYLFVKKQPFYNGVSYAFIAIGLIQLVVGISIYFRCDIDTVRVLHFIEKERKSIKDYEIPRMELVMKNFMIYRWVEMALIGVGLILFLRCELKSLGNGLGIGLFIQASIMLFLDYLAEKRGSVYLNYLISLS